MPDMLGRRASRLAAGCRGGIRHRRPPRLGVGADAAGHHPAASAAPRPGHIRRSGRDGQAHNAWRTRAGVLPIRWAADLAAQSQNHALQLARHDCALEHGRLRTMWERTCTGRARSNRRAAAGPSMPCLPRTSSMSGRRVRRLLPSTGSCAPGRQCGHYTQIGLAVDRRSRLRHGGLPVPRAGLGLRYRPRGNVRVLRK